MVVVVVVGGGVIGLCAFLLPETELSVIGSRQKNDKTESK